MEDREKRQGQRRHPHHCDEGKKLRIEVGYGWEGGSPTSKPSASSARSSQLHFKQAQFAQGIDAGIDKIQLAVVKGNKAESNTVNDKGQWTQSHNATRTDATIESLMGMAPVLLGVLAVLSFLLPSLLVGGIAAVGTFFSPTCRPAAGVAGFIGFVIANILRGIFGSIRRSRSVGAASTVIPAGAAAVGHLAVVAGRQAAVVAVGAAMAAASAVVAPPVDGAMAAVAVIAEAAAE